MITTNNGFKKIEASDYVSAALSDEDSAFNLNVDRMEQAFSEKLPNRDGNLFGKTTLEEGASLAFRNGEGSDMQALSLKENGDIEIGGEAAEGNLRLFSGGEAFIAEGGNDYRVWTAKNLIVSAQEPASPKEGDIWIDIS